MKKHAKKIITLLLAVALLVPTVAMIFPSAAIVDYPVELAFDNIFVFDKWANNSLSTTIVSNGAPVKDKLDIDINNGSFTFTNQYSGEAYTGHGMGTGAVDSAGNFQYYMMEVEPGATYTLSYNLSGLASGLVFTPYIFFFDESGSYITLNAQSFSGSGDTSFAFSVPSNAHYIQIRFTISNTGSANVKDIAIRKTEVYHGNNIFDFNAWADNALSSKKSDDPSYNGGDIAKNYSNNSVTLTTNGAAGILFSNFTFGNGNGYYMMPVEANTSYNYSYNLVSFNFAEARFYEPYIVFYRANGDFISYSSSPAANAGVNETIINTPADAAYAQIVFGIVGIAEAGKTCTVKDVAIQKITVASTSISDVPHRIVYTYKGDSTTPYGKLPVPTSIPNGYVFAGWYTGINGTGELITENTLVKHSSYTVYPKYEPIVNSISIKTMPVKTEYTVGERVNPTGLVLEATVGSLTTTVESGYRCTPEYLTAAGTQTVTVHYGGKTTTYTVNVSTSASKSVVVNGSNVNVTVANNVYTFGTLSTGEFNKYVITYSADAYFEGIITYSDGVTEQFFLEPSSNFAAGETPKFTSFVDGYLEKVIDGAGQTTAINSHSRAGIKSIAFTPLDNKAGSIDLLSFTTKMDDKITSAPATIKSFSDDKFKVEVDILNGGVVSGLYVLNRDVVARVYRHYDTEGNYTDETKVDFRENLSDEGYISESTNVNLINIYDTGRYLQQSYYGTLEKPYEPGYYNQADWHYNPVQGGNVANEASKVIDYEIGDNYIYVKARPLDWARWSDEHAKVCTHETEIHTEPKWGDGYITDTYIEAKYVFEDGTIKTYCRMVDYSGLPSAQTTQELPAFYTIEPLNNFVYNDVTEEEAWVIKDLKYEESPEFWGITQDYINAHYPNGGFDPNVDVAERWAAFMASESSNSFGIGLYTPETTNFFYGCYPAKYSGKYRHTSKIDPANDDTCSYIAPIGIQDFESYKPSEYTYTLAIGTVDQIHDTFGMVNNKSFEAELNRAQIAVPETIYMKPDAGQSKTGQYFVNNRLDQHGNLIADAVNNATNGIISVYAPGSTAISFNVSAIKGGIGDPVIGGGTVTDSYEGTRWGHKAVFDAYGTGAAKDWFEFKALGLAINGTGVSAGGTALLEWEVTIYYGDSDATGEKHYAYTTLYSPWFLPVGAATRAQSGSNGSKVYDQSVAWVSGVHGYKENQSGYYYVASTNQNIADEGEQSGKGTYYAKTSNYALVPLLYGVGNPGNTGTAVLDFLTSSSPGGGVTSPTIRYFNLTASSGNFGILVSDISPVANITVDTSRYTNFNQIPNLTVGYNITDIDNASSVQWYVSDITDLANSVTDAKADANEANFYNYTKQESADGIVDKAKNEWFTAKATGNLIYGSDTVNCGSSTYTAVSGEVEYNAAWDRQIITGSNSYAYMFKGAAHAYASKGQAYSINNVQVLATNVNKTALRDLIALASSLNEENYTDASWSAFKTALQNAAIELGNPTDSDIAAATTELTNKMMALETPATLVANGGSFSGGATTAYVNLVCGPSLAPYYTIPVSNNPTYAGYSIDGWSTDKNATEGTNPVMGGLKPIFYAIWTEGSCTIVYNANGGAGFIADVTFKRSDSVELASSGFSREGYSLIGWAKSATATSPQYLLGQIVSGLANNTDTTITLYAVWTENKYTVIYDANGGSGSIANQTVNGSASFTLASSGFTKKGSTLLGWSTNASASIPEYQLGQTVSRLAAGGSITLYAVWSTPIYNVTFDNLIDFDAYNKSLSSTKGTVTNITDTGFTITSLDAVSEATLSSAYFAVEAGKSYRIDVDITGKGWDVYIFFHNETSTGTGLEFSDGKNRFSDNGGAGTNVFTAPAGATKAQIRVDCNGIHTGTVNNVKQYASNTVTFNNIRVYEDTGITVSPVNKYVQYNDTYGELPTPTKANYNFVGWYTADGKQITESTTVTQTSTLNLFSKWVVNDSALVKDTVVIEFGTPINIDPFANDKVFNEEIKTPKATYSFLGISTDGVNYSATLNGTYGTFTANTQNKNVTYTPKKVVDGVERTVYYHAEITTDAGTAIVKSQIIVAPASNILYEETFFNAKSSTGNAWALDGTTATANQIADDTVYGYDKSYVNAKNYSSGSAYKVTVDTQNRSSKIMEFNFKGTGFDLNSVCGPTTGVFVVTVKNMDTGAFLSPYVIDTYYSDSDYGNDANGNLYQVPVIHATDLAYANYYVQVASSYLPTYSGAIKNPNHVQTQAVEGANGMTVSTASVYNDDVLLATLAEMGMEEALESGEINLVWFDENSVLNGGMGANTPEKDMLETAATIEIPLDNYIDSVRVYNPIADGNSYYIKSEQNADYINVIGNLLEKNKLTGESIFAYISGNSYVDGTDRYDITLDSYDKHGPKDELYLANGTNAVTFRIKDFDKNSMKVMVSLRGASGTPKLKVDSAEITVSSKTEMYYDITPYVDESGTVVIQNTASDSLLAVGNLKITGESIGTAAVLSDVDFEVVKAMMMAPATEVEPNVPVVPEEPVIPEVPEDTTDPTEPEDTTDEPETNDGTTDDNSSSEDDSSKCWFLRLIDWIIEKLVYIFNFVKSLFNI